MQGAELLVRRENQFTLLHQALTGEARQFLRANSNLRHLVDLLKLL